MTKFVLKKQLPKFPPILFLFLLALSAFGQNNSNLVNFSKETTNTFISSNAPVTTQFATTNGGFLAIKPGAITTNNVLSGTAVTFPSLTTQQFLAIGTTGQVYSVPAPTSSTGLTNVFDPNIFTNSGGTNISGRAGATWTNLLSMGSGVNSTAIGTNATAAGIAAIAIGSNATAGQTFSLSIGHRSLSSGSNSTAVGKQANAATSGTAIGQQSIATNSATSIGQGSSATGTSAIALGQATASGVGSSAFGAGAVASGNQSVAIGQSANITTDDSTGVGESTSATSGTKATALGFGAAANFASSTAIGASAATTIANQIMLGTVNESVTVLGTFTLPNLTTQQFLALGTTGQVYSVPAPSGGGGGTAGTLINSNLTATTAGQLVQFLGTDKTNTGPVTVGAGLLLSGGTLSVTNSTNNLSYASLSTTLNTVTTNGTNAAFAVAQIQALSAATGSPKVTMYVETVPGTFTGIGLLGEGALASLAVTNTMGGIPIPPNARLYITNESGGSGTTVSIVNAWLVTLTGSAAGGGGGIGTAGTLINSNLQTTVQGNLIAFASADKTNTVPVTISTGLSLNTNQIPYVLTASGSAINYTWVKTTNQSTTTSTNFADVSGMSATLTNNLSSAVNGVLVTMTVSFGGSPRLEFIAVNGANTQVFPAVGTLPANYNSQMIFYNNDGNTVSTFSFTFVDFPGTVTPTAYKLQWRSDITGQTVAFNRSVNDGTAANYNTKTSSGIYVQELK